MSLRRSKIPKLIPLISFIILLVLGPIVFSLLQTPDPAAAGWVDDNFSYRNAIPITSHTAAENNVYITATIDTSASGQFQADCGDLRFTTVGGDILPYYIVSGCVSASTVVHVFFKSMPAGAQTIYYYYGNPSAANGFSSADFATLASSYALGSPTSQEKGGAPIAYWKFDDATGTNAQDSSPNNNDGTLSGTTLPTWQTEDRCISGKCLKFDGSTSRINLTNGGNISYTNGFSISLWFYGNSFSTPNAPELYRVAVTGTNKWISLRIGYNNELEFMTRGASSDIEINSPNNYISENKWYHVTAVYNPSGTTMLFINGIQMTDTSTANAGTITLNGTTTIGQGFNSWSWNGTIDEVKVYSYARTAAQIKSDFKSRGTAKGSSVVIASGTKQSMSEGLVGYWKMDEAAANSCTGGVNDSCDSSGNGRDGAFQTSMTNSNIVSGKYGNAVYFDGTDDHTDLGTPLLTTTDANQPYSGFAWIKTTDADGGIITQYSGSGDRWGFRAQSTLRYWKGGSDLATSTTTINDGNWHHVGFVKTSTQQIFLYIDGKQDGSGTDSLDFENVNTVIGKFGTGSVVPYIGTIDDLRIYNRALSPREVRDLYAWAPGPYTYLSFDEGTGTAINDKSGNGYSGAWNGSGTHWVTGKFGKAGNFNGTSDYVSFSSLPKPTNLPITIEFWTKPSTATPVGIFDSAPSQQYVLRNYASGEVEWWPDTPQLSLGLTASTWTHLAFIYNYSGGNQTIEWYKNGVKQTTVSSAGAGTWAWTSFILGNINGGSAGWYSGDLDEFKIYNYARTQKQIVEDMNAGHPAGGSPVGSQVGYWKFDEGQGSTTNNSGFGSNLNGTITGATWNNNGKFGKALSFAGSTNSVSVSSIANVGTVSLWVNPSTNSQSLLALTAGAYISASSGTITATGFTSPTIYVNGRVGSTLTANVWNHVVVTTDTGITASALTIGRANSSSLTGLIDEVKIYNSALTSDEIQIDYNRGQALVLGNTGDASSSAGAIYCQPGSSDTCTPPVGEWNFEESTGNPNDSSGNGNNGTWNGTGTHWADGKLGRAGNFNGTDDYVRLTSNVVMTGSGSSIAFWFNTNAFNKIPIGKENDNDTYIFPLNSTTISVQTDIGATGKNFTVPTLSLGTWYYLVVTRNSNTTRVYLNGVESSSGGQTQSDDLTVNQIGKYGAGTSGYWYNGKIDQVRIFNYARSAAQVAWDYNQGKPIAQWKMDECQGASVFDASGNGNTGTITIGATGTQTAVGTCTTSGTAWYNGVTGKFNSSLNFDGTDDSISASLFPSVTYNGTYSFSAWIKPTNNSGTQTIFQNSNSGSDRSGMIYETDNVKFGYYNGVSWFGVAGPITAGSWYHVVGVNNQTSLILYINGIPKTTSSSPYVGSGGFLIGRTSTVGQYNYFNGQIDDVRIYNYALTPLQIRLLFNGSSAVRFGPQTGSP